MLLKITIVFLSIVKQHVRFVLHSQGLAVTDTKLLWWIASGHESRLRMGLQTENQRSATGFYEDRDYKDTGWV